MNIEHPPAMHHKRWWHDHCHRAETPGHSTKTTQRHCGQVERPTSNVEWEKMKKQTYDLEERLLKEKMNIEHRTSNIER